MKTLLAAAAAVALAAMAIAQAPATGDDPLLKAMRDEAARSSELSLPGIDPPYFVEYVLDQADSFVVSASLGGLLSRRREALREPEVHVRVGSYKFDNTNFAGGGFGGSRYDLESFPMENSYPVLRRYLWLYTDSAYKAAVEALSRKRAALRDLQQGDQIDDFARAEPVHYVKPFGQLAIDEDEWANRVRALSAIFEKYPDVKNSDVELQSAEGGYFVVNSEGTEVKAVENVTFVRVRAQAQAADGMTMRDAVAFHSLDLTHMPSQAEMERGAATLAENVTALAKAPLGEDYNGPVLFDGVAGPQIFAEVLGKNLALVRRPAGGRGGSAPSSDFEGRVGARVLPDTFDVVDDPTQKEWRGRPLFGSYDVDREGVIPKPLRLVEKGMLKAFLLTRQPVRGFEGSNGRARLPGTGASSYADISNLFVSSSETLPGTDLKKKLIEMIQQRNKPYGIIVRKMDFPSSATEAGELRSLLQASQGAAHPVSMPLLVYKVFPDGHEELVRGLRFRAFTARSMKDIVAAGDEQTVFEFMDNEAPFALVNGASFTAETCVVAPSILIDDLELHPADEEQPKLPVVPAPEMTKR